MIDLGASYLSARVAALPFPLFPIATACSDKISSLKNLPRIVAADKRCVDIICKQMLVR